MTPRPFHTQVLVEALTPIAHHEGNDGNHANQMTARMRLSDGTFGRIPIVTGDTMRHWMREMSAKHLLSIVEAPPLTEAALRLLFGGGMLTGKGDASQVRIDAFRALEQLCPSLTLFGGCVNGSMIPGRLQVEQMTLICEETRHTIPETILAAAEAVGPLVSYRQQTDQVMRVRMDPTGNPLLQHHLSEPARRRLAGRVDAREAAHESGDAVAAAAVKTTMMPRTHDVICQGALFSWQITGHFHSEMDEAAYYSTLAYMQTSEARVGGKKGTGAGRFTARMINNAPVLTPRQTGEAVNITALGQSLGKQYLDYLTARKGEICDFLARVDA